jgi:hypothetical protein
VLKQGISKIDSCRPRSAPRHRAHTPATPGHANRVYLSTAARPARPCRAALAVRRHGCHRHLGELLLAPSTKLCTHAYPFLVTYNTSPRRALRRPRRRLASSQAASAGAAQHRRSSPPAPLHSRLRPRLGRRWAPSHLPAVPRPSPGAASPESIAGFLFFSGAWVWTRDWIVRLWKVLRASTHKHIFDSISKLLNLVNSLENRRKIRKMQTQFS